ncbi:MAG: DUF368 domain-containing protein [Wenyingzhuangia sp.]|uniref:DUF368 domain-containing protein n=1 Tax=Wenyingzhuangia sp. TaxID=1964193 RepID=UPI00321A44FE
MAPKSSFLYHLLLFLKGGLMGVANKVPGVSGGAVAYVLGFYSELIYSFPKINAKAFSLLLNGRLKSFFHYINAKFLVSILGGVVFSYFTISKLLDYFLKHYELRVWSLFFGMIIGSGIYLIKKYEGWEFRSYLYLGLGVLTGIAITFIHPTHVNENLWFVFFCGVIGVSGMTIPGLSGSYILMLMGNYTFLLVDSVNVLTDFLFSFFLRDAFYFNEITQKYVLVILVFTLGSIFGLIFFSKLLVFILRKWSKVVNALIIGFIIGSLGAVWPWKEKIYIQNQNETLVGVYPREVVAGFYKYLPNITSSETWMAFLFVFLGVFLVICIERLSKIN